MKKCMVRKIKDKNGQHENHTLPNLYNRSKEDKVAQLAKNLGIPMTPELMQLGSNEAISNDSFHIEFIKYSFD